METIYSLIKIEEKKNIPTIDVVCSFTLLIEAKVMLNELFNAELAEYWEGHEYDDYVEVTIRDTSRSIEDVNRGARFSLFIKENQLMR